MIPPSLSREHFKCDEKGAEIKTQASIIKDEERRR